MVRETLIPELKLPQVDACEVHKWNDLAEYVSEE
jgi:hypothetical protein